MVLARLHDSCDCLGVNPRARYRTRFWFPSVCPVTSLPFLLQQAGLLGIPATRSIPSVPFLLFSQSPSQQPGRESPPFLSRLLHIWPFLLDPAGGMPPHLIHVDSKILRLSAGKSFIIFNVTPGIGGKSRGMNAEYVQGRLLGLGPGSEWEEHQWYLRLLDQSCFNPSRRSTRPREQSAA